MSEFRSIARIENDFTTKIGIQRQSNRIDALKARIIFEPEFRNPDAFRGLEDFSHIWLIWEFSEVKRENWSATVRPHRLGGNERTGVFATRSPFRPNPIGLSSVKLERIERHPALGPVLHVSGADLMNGTPILDIKPYLAYSDAHPDARNGFVDLAPDHHLTVDFPELLLSRIPAGSRDSLLAVLAEDPRPAYQKDPDRTYGIAFAGKDIHFTVRDDLLRVTDVSEYDPKFKNQNPHNPPV